MKDILDMTADEFKDVGYKLITSETEIDSFVIVPTGELHDSGFACMKFVLLLGHEIIGSIGGYSDVVYLNGIGGYGDYHDYNYQEIIKTKLAPVVGWQMDCLPCGLIRIFCGKRLKVDNFIGSDFQVYVTNGVLLSKTTFECDDKEET